MTLSEAARHVERFRADPSSALAADVEGWEHPVSREAAILMDLWDLEYAKTGAKQRQQYQRPWKTKGDTKHYGDRGRPVLDLLTILRPEPPV